MKIPTRILDLLPNLHEGIYVVDHSRKIVFWNEGAERITGYKKDQVEGHYCYNNLLKHIDEYGKELCHGGCPLHKSMKSNKINNAEVYLHHKDGHRVSVHVRTIPIIDDGHIVGAIEAFTDQTFQEDYFKQNQELIEKIAYDHLMGIYNREYLDLHLKQKLEEAKLIDTTFGLLFIDVDRFKEINDSYGHLMGDEVLKLIARTLSSNLRSKDIIGRYGGDELMILLDVEDKEALFRVSNKLRTLVDYSSFKQISPTITIGATMVHDDDDIVAITKRADEALYEAKEAGRNRVVIK
jgi:diguanylate cyclase (GGDEF)-like protein/PAS domain S-box-containing protein